MYQDDASGAERPRFASTRRQFIGRSAGVALSVGGLGSFLSACGGSGGGEVVVVSWAGDYLSPVLAQILKEEANLTLKPVPSEADQDMFTKVKAGGGGAYDIVFANCGWSPTYYKNGLIEAFDVHEVANGDQLWPIFRENTALPYVLAPNKITLFPNMWDSLSLIWNTHVAYQPSEPYSWQSLWDPAVPKGKVVLKGAPEDFLAISGLSLGVPKDQIYAMQGDQLQQAAKHLAALKPFQIAGSDDVFDKDIQSEKAWIGQSPSLAAAPRINNAAGSTVVKAVTPKEGTLGWVDGPQLVKGAKNRANALKFMEVWNGERWQTHLFDKLGYAQCNEAATKRVLARGGAAAQNVRDHGGDNPSQVTDLVFQGPPADPTAWSQAYDQVVGG
jgi:spermidine/putrescine transport system substrate-binding protein